VSCRHSGEWRFSPTQTINLSTTVNAHEWSAACPALPPPPPCPLNRRLGGNFGVKENLFPCQESNYDASAIKPVAYSIYQLCYLSSV